MVIVSKAPCRVDLAGSTLDIWPLYLFHAGAVTVNFAVDLYMTCEVATRADNAIVLRSRDLAIEEQFSSLAEMADATEYRLPLLAYILRFFSPQTGVEVTTHSEAPLRAGISASSSLLIAMACALNKLTRAGYSIEKLREIAQNVEAQIIRLPTGSQDYYPAMYGGVNAIQLTAAGIERFPINLDPRELDERMVMAYTGPARVSGVTHWEMMKLHLDGDHSTRSQFKKVSDLASGMRTALGKEDWAEAGRVLRDEWTYRRKNSSGVTTPLIDQLVDRTRRAGSTGAKVCGAGGGGCVFFLVEKGMKAQVVAVVEQLGAKVLPLSVSAHGVRLRTLRS